MAGLKPTELLRDAVEAGRAALRDMEPDQVPARLRRVAASSERNLPAPLALALLREIDGDEFVREAALEAWDGDRPPAGGPASASYAFLDRSAGWVLTVVAEASALGERRGAAGDRSLELERDSLAAEVAALRERLRRAREQADQELKELQSALDEERAPGRSRSRAERRAAEELEEARGLWQRREEQLQAELDRAGTELRQARDEARAQRRARADLEAAAESGDTSFPSDPVALARLLDGLVAHVTARSAPASGPVGRAEGGRPVVAALDPSVRPDSAEAIDWLIATAPPAVLVDGYNLGFQLAGLDAVRARALALEAVRRLGAVVPSSAVTVVFDSAFDADDAQAASRAGNAMVVFTAGRSADDEIVERVCAGEPTVVVTNDRDLRHRAESCGAVALWSDALVEWSRRR